MVAIKLNGGAAGAAASVAASSVVTATLDSTAGVRSCSWQVVATDDSSSVGDYALTVSGSVGQTCTVTAGAAGTAVWLRATINGGIDLATEDPSDATQANAKFYVETVDGVQVLCAGELDSGVVISDATSGAVAVINAGLRVMGTGTGMVSGGGASADGELAAYDGTSGQVIGRTYISASVPAAGAVQLAPTTAGETLVLAGGDAPGATGGDVLILAGDGTTKGKVFLFDLPAAGYGAQKWLWVANSASTPTNAGTDGAWFGAVSGKLYTRTNADGLGQLAAFDTGGSLTATGGVTSAGRFDVLSYGAKRDGTSAAATRAAIQAAIDDASTALLLGQMGAEVVLPAGLYTIDATPLRLKDGVTLRGHGSGHEGSDAQGATIIDATAATYGIDSDAGSTLRNASIVGLTIKHATTAGIRIDNFHRLSIERVAISGNTPTGIRLGATGGLFATLDHVDCSGLNSGAGTAAKLENCGVNSVRSCVLRQGAIGLVLDGVWDTDVSANDFEGTGIGVQITGASGVHSHDNYFEGNSRAHDVDDSAHVLWIGHNTYALTTTVGIYVAGAVASKLWAIDELQLGNCGSAFSGAGSTGLRAFYRSDAINSGATLSGLTIVQGTGNTTVTGASGKLTLATTGGNNIETAAPFVSTGAISTTSTLQRSGADVVTGPGTVTANSVAVLAANGLSVAAANVIYTASDADTGGASLKLGGCSKSTLSCDGSNVYLGWTSTVSTTYVLGVSCKIYGGTQEVIYTDSTQCQIKKALLPQAGISGAVAYNSAIAPAGLAAGQTDNWAPTGLATCSRITVTADGGGSALSGFDVTGCLDGQTWLIYATGGVLTLKHNTTSTVKFICPGAVDKVLANPDVIRVTYVSGTGLLVG